MNKSKNKSRLVNVIALFWGCLVGLVLNITGHTDVSHTFLSPIGSLYVRILQFVALPMIFCLVIDSITSQSSLKKIASLAYRTIFCNFISAIVIGVVTFCVTIFFVTQNYSLSLASFESNHMVCVQNYMDALMNTVPSSILGNFMQNNLFFVFITAILLGIFIMLEKVKLVFFARMITSITFVLEKMMNIIIALAPVGIFSIVANAFAINDLSALENLLSLIVMACIICIFYILIITLFESFATKKSFRFCLKTTLPVVFFGFITCSSVACVSLAQNCADDLGCRRNISSFVIPSTNLLIKAGGILYIYSLLAFAIIASGNVLPIYKWFFMIFIAMFCSLTAPAMPMIGILIIPTALAYLSVTSNPKLFGLLCAIDPFIDMINTAATCASNVFCAVMVDKFSLHKKK